MLSELTTYHITAKVVDFCLILYMVVVHQMHGNSIGATLSRDKEMVTLLSTSTPCCGLYTITESHECVYTCGYIRCSEYIYITLVTMKTISNILSLLGVSFFFQWLAAPLH